MLRASILLVLSIVVAVVLAGDNCQLLNKQDDKGAFYYDIRGLKSCVNSIFFKEVIHTLLFFLFSNFPIIITIINFTRCVTAQLFKLCCRFCWWLWLQDQFLRWCQLTLQWKWQGKGLQLQGYSTTQIPRALLLLGSWCRYWWFSYGNDWRKGRITRCNRHLH